MSLERCLSSLQDILVDDSDFSLQQLKKAAIRANFDDDDALALLLDDEISDDDSNASDDSHNNNNNKEVVIEEQHDDDDDDVPCIQPESTTRPSNHNNFSNLSFLLETPQQGSSSSSKLKLVTETLKHININDLLHNNRTTTIQPFSFDTPSPDDIARRKRERTSIHGGGKTTKADKYLRKTRLIPRKLSRNTHHNNKEKKESMKDIREKRLSMHIAERQKNSNHYESCTIAMIGRQKSGKSTLTGQILCALGMISPKDLYSVSQKATRVKKSDMKFAWLTDVDDDERIRYGHTRRPHIWHLPSLSSLRSDVYLIDSPGVRHSSYLANTLSIILCSKIVCIVIQAKPNIKNECRYVHEILNMILCLRSSSSLPIIMICINCMDKIHYNNEIYMKYEKQLYELTNNLLLPLRVIIVPISAIKDENINKRKDTRFIEWYDDNTMIEALQHAISLCKKAEVDYSLYDEDVCITSFNIQYSKHNTSVNIDGYVCCGHVFHNDQLLLVPSNVHVRVNFTKSACHDGHNHIVLAGDYVNLVCDMEKQNIITATTNDIVLTSMPLIMEEKSVVYQVRMTLLDESTTSSAIISNGTLLYVRFNHDKAQKYEARVKHIDSIINPMTNDVIQYAPPSLRIHQVAICNIVFTESLNFNIHFKHPQCRSRVCIIEYNNNNSIGCAQFLFTL